MPGPIASYIDPCLSHLALKSTFFISIIKPIYAKSACYGTRLNQYSPLPLHRSACIKPTMVWISSNSWHVLYSRKLKISFLNLIGAWVSRNICDMPYTYTNSPRLALHMWWSLSLSILHLWSLLIWHRFHPYISSALAYTFWLSVLLQRVNTWEIGTSLIPLWLGSVWVTHISTCKHFRFRDPHQQTATHLLHSRSLKWFHCT